MPLPAGAIRVYDWDPPEVTGYANGNRYFVCASRRIDSDDTADVSRYFLDGI